MRRVVAEVDLQRRMDALAARVREETQIPGIVLGASVDGRRTYAAAGSYIAGERRRLGKSATFALGCASKLPLAIRAHELARHGALDLRSPIAAYLPELRGSACGETVLCEHLLSHTSGYRGTSIFDGRTRALSWDGLVAYLQAAPQLFAPGTVFSYEHTESVLLFEIIRRVEGAATDDGHAAASDAENAGRHVFDERRVGSSCSTPPTPSHRSGNRLSRNAPSRSMICSTSAKRRSAFPSFSVASSAFRHPLAAPFASSCRSHSASAAPSCAAASAAARALLRDSASAFASQLA